MAEIQPEGRDSGGLYAVLIILVILIVAAVLYFSGALGGAAGAREGGKTEIHVPAEAGQRSDSAPGAER